MFHYEHPVRHVHNVPVGTLGNLIHPIRFAQLALMFQSEHQL